MPARRRLRQSRSGRARPGRSSAGRRPRTMPLRRSQPRRCGAARRLPWGPALPWRTPPTASREAPPSPGGVHPLGNAGPERDHQVRSSRRVGRVPSPATESSGHATHRGRVGFDHITGQRHDRLNGGPVTRAGRVEDAEGGDDPSQRPLSGMEVGNRLQAQLVQAGPVASNHQHGRRSCCGQGRGGTDHHRHSVDLDEGLVRAHPGAGATGQHHAHALTGRGHGRSYRARAQASMSGLAVASGGGQPGSSCIRNSSQRSASPVSPIRAATRCSPLRARRNPRLGRWTQRT